MVHTNSRLASTVNMFAVAAFFVVLYYVPVFTIVMVIGLALVSDLSRWLYSQPGNADYHTPDPYAELKSAFDDIFAEPEPLALPAPKPAPIDFDSMNEVIYGAQFDEMLRETEFDIDEPSEPTFDPFAIDDDKQAHIACQVLADFEADEPEFIDWDAMSYREVQLAVKDMYGKQERKRLGIKCNAKKQVLIDWLTK